MDKVEKLARIICRAHDIDPDMQVVRGEPFRVFGGDMVYFAAPHKDTVLSAWMIFGWPAKSALEAGFDCPDDPTPVDEGNQEVSPLNDSVSVSGDFHASEDLPAPSDGSAWRERLSRMGLTHNGESY